MTHSQNNITTPFGGGKFSAVILERQIWLNNQREKGQGGDNENAAVNKWDLLRALTDARKIFGLSDRTIAVLEALASFHQTPELDGREDIVVFPSNIELSRRTRGMAPATLRRHLAALVKAGLIIRRDSPNGKRYARRNGAGGIDQAFGFNLAPFALMAAEIFDNAEVANAELRTIQKLRAEITIFLRDCRRLVDLAFEDGKANAAREEWMAFEGRLDALSGRLARNEPLISLEPKKIALTQLQAEIEELWLDQLDLEDDGVGVIDDEVIENINMSANGVINERHIHNSKTESIFEKSIDNLKSSGRQDSDYKLDEYELETEANPREYQLSLRKFEICCPEFAAYAPSGLSNWVDAKAAGHLVRPMLGISADAWENAKRKMGDIPAIVVLAYILERYDEIKSPGGYLRTLTERAEIGKLSIKAMLDSL
ncbi:MAG: plasmid replication protein RepC [Hyphomicrobiales bacterium]